MTRTWPLKRIVLIAALAIAAILVFVACGDDDDDGSVAASNGGVTATNTPASSGDGATEPAEVDEELSGSIAIDGSSTVYPVSEGVAEEFTQQHPGVNVTVAFSGTGGGFEKFCSGDTQISNASRPIADDEVEACAEAGIEWTEFRVAIDGLSVVVNPENDWVSCLTVEQLSQMFGPDSAITTWADVDPSWPDEEITFYIPGTDSGTFDYFTEMIGGESGATRTTNIVTSEDDNVLVQGVEGDRYAIGYFGYAYYIENQDRMKVLEIDGSEGCVAPNDKTVQSNEYQPLSRPLFIYVNNQAIREQPEVAEFARYYFSDGLEVIPQVGYVPYTDDVYRENLAKLDEVLGS